MICRWFRDSKSAAKFLRTERGCDLCGIVSLSTPAARPQASTLPAVTSMPTPASEVCGGVTDSCHEIDIGTSPARMMSCGGDSSGQPGETPDQGFGEHSEGRKEARTASTAVRHRPFRRSTAFFVGHRNRLADDALDVCDFFVHVEQVGELVCMVGALVWSVCNV